MRKFFSFSFSPRNSDKPPSATQSDTNTERVFWEKPWQSDTEEETISKRNSRGSKKSSVARTTSSRNAPVPETSSGTSVGSYLRRSLSFTSSATPYGSGSRVGDEVFQYVEDGRRSSASGCYSDLRPNTDATIIAPSSTPERLFRTRRRDMTGTTTRKMHAPERIESPTSANQASSGKSPHSSPVPLRCRSARLTQLSHHHPPLDLYIDGEQQEMMAVPDSRRFDTSSCLAENRTIVNSGKPPRAHHSTAPSSPTYNKENVKCHHQSLDDPKGSFFHRSVQDWAVDHEFRQGSSSPPKLRKKLAHKLSHSSNGRRSRLTSREYDSSETGTTATTVEDIYEDTQELQRDRRRCSSSVEDDHSGYCHQYEEVLESPHYTKFLDSQYMKKNAPSFVFGRNDMYLDHIYYGEDTDEELGMKLKEAEKRYSVLFDTECQEFQSNCSVQSLLQTIEDINRDRKNLALELLTQVQCRVADRGSARDALKQAHVELDTRTRRLEREKQEIQSALEKEIDRRSSDWLVKLEKFQTEEQRLRDRVRDLAEQNVSLQREVSSLTSREVDTNSRIMNLEMQLNELTVKMEGVKIENENLHQELTELKERCDSAEADREYMKRSYQVKDKENKDLQKIVVRLQRTCDENEKTITGLRRGWNDEIAKQQSVDRNDAVSRLQAELLRLTGVEQALRREVESCRSEVETLRGENVSLLDRLKNGGTGCGSSVFRLENEVHRRVEVLKNQGMSLLSENSDLCRKLLGIVESQQYPETSSEFGSFCIMDYNMKYENLRRGIERLRKSLMVISGVLGEKSLEQSDEKQQWTDEESLSKQSEYLRSEDMIQLELKAETLLTRILQEKLCSNELEIERLQGELASSIRGQDALRADMQRLQDEISTMSHQAKDMEHQIVRKDESFHQLELEYGELSREFNVHRGLLPKVSEERNCLWEEVQRLKESDMLLKHEVKLLKNKIESLEEDILVKEGQITILKDSLANKQPFDLLYSPNSLKEYSL